MNKVKECIMCFSEIDERARKCRYCSSLQAKYSNLENNPVIIAVLTILLFVIFGYIYYESVYMRATKKEAQKDLIVKISEVSKQKDSEKLYVACMGTIENPLDFSFTEVELEARFLNKNNELIDSIVYNNEGLTVPANGDVAFKIRGEAQKEESNYAACKVKILDAWAR